MRLRSTVALSAVTLSALLLAGCSGSSDTEPTPEASGPVSLCDAASPSGAASDAVKATGELGTVPDVSFETPLETGDVEYQRTVIAEGEGESIAAGDFVRFALTTIDGRTGEFVGSVGQPDNPILPQQISAENGGEMFGCATAGSRIAFVFATGDETTPTGVYVIDVLGTTPTAAWGEPQEPVAGMPEVVLGDDGAPTITIPDAAPPAQTELATLKLGDGPVVQPGDTALVQYTGVRWSNGETFDSSWDKGGVPVPLATTGVVEGFRKALEGHTVGSQILVVMTPADGYGDGEINTTDLKGDTLVFVVDILGTQAPAAQPQ